MNKKEYLIRINYNGDETPSLVLLQKLQKSHLLHIPFENLDIHFGKTIELDEEKIYDKIIYNNRGGFCYELNSLFYKLLIAIGFKAKRISARVYNKDKGYGQEYDHMATIVSIDGKEYLTDVGFGEFSFSPLLLELNKIQKDERGEYLIDKYDGEYLRVSRLENGELTPEYIFKNVHRKLYEFEEMCRYHQNSPDSHFTHKKLISIPTENGRITLTDHTLKVKTNNKVEERKLIDETAFFKELIKWFDIGDKNNI